MTQVTYVTLFRGNSTDILAALILMGLVAYFGGRFPDPIARVIHSPKIKSLDKIVLARFPDPIARVAVTQVTQVTHFS
jgi:hypothetical protein